MKPLTIRQHDALQAIADFWADTNMAPCVRDVGDRMGLRSPASVQQHLWALRANGYVDWALNTTGTLRLTAKGEDALKKRPAD